MIRGVTLPLCTEGKPGHMASDRPATYAIWVSGTLDAEWSDRLGGLHVRQVRAGVQPMSELVGEVIDQTALAGVLTTLYELGLPIISVDRLAESQTDSRKKEVEDE